jgi:hypothetical protein
MILLVSASGLAEITGMNHCVQPTNSSKHKRVHISIPFYEAGIALIPNPDNRIKITENYG